MEVLRVNTFRSGMWLFSINTQITQIRDKNTKSLHGFKHENL